MQLHEHSGNEEQCPEYQSVAGPGEEVGCSEPLGYIIGQGPCNEDRGSERMTSD
jgi:hypothetical protein